MPHVDPELVNLLRALAAVGGIILSYFTIGKRIWRWWRKRSTRSVEPGE